jgi:hypothetical protein
MGFRRCVALAAMLATMAATADAAPAHATIFNKDHFTFQDSDEEDLCGIAVRHDITASGRFRNRTGKGDLDQAFFGQSTVELTESFTNLATGASFSTEARVTAMDVKATPLGGDIFEFKTRESGTTVLRDNDGNVVLREAGAIWTIVVFDTLGDSMPGGDTLDETVLRVSGPHPLFDMDDAAFCGMVQGLIG